MRSPTILGGRGRINPRPQLPARRVCIGVDLGVVDVVEHGFTAWMKDTGERVDPARIRAMDSPRWCELCQAWGDHHTDRHQDSRLPRA